MLTEYDIHAPDLGTALSIAAQRAHNDGFTHTSVQATKQLDRTTWRITMFVSNAQGLTHRDTDPNRAFR